MKYTTVSALCEGVAGAIREQDGSTALINPQDFADRIKGLEVGGASGSKMRYFTTELARNNAWVLGSVLRAEVDGEVHILPFVEMEGMLGDELYDKNKVVAFAVNVDAKFYMDGSLQTIGDAGQITKYCAEITEEQFYDTTTFLTPQEITFTVKHEMNPVEYTALDGMTWEEFCNSEYNEGGWGKLFFDCEAIGDGRISAADGALDAGVVQLNGSNVYKTDIIQPNANYTTSNPLG